jgi:hypothetical protein
MGKNKYSTEVSKAADLYIPRSVPRCQAKLIRASVSSSTWNRHLSALNCFYEYKKLQCDFSDFPMPKETVRNFVTYALNTKGLKPSTVQNYLSSLSFYHKLRDFETNNCNDFTVKTMIKGAENLDIYSSITKSCRKAMSYPLLKILSHKIAAESWCELDKQAVWTSFTLAFFGSFRFGELVSQNKRVFNAKETLLWSDVHLKQDYAVIHLKVTKTKSSKGEHIDLFLQPDCKYCPVKALKRLYRLANPSNPNMPVFRLANGEFLTVQKINVLVQKLLHPVIGNVAYSLSAHSFRAGLASLMASRPDKTSDSEIRSWGRWSSDSYMLYTRLKFGQKRAIYDKIVSILNKNH